MATTKTSPDSEPNPDSTTDDPRICFCMKVHQRQIQAAIDDGARSPRDISDATRAGTGCGTCRMDLLVLLAKAGHPYRDRE